MNCGMPSTAWFDVDSLTENNTPDEDGINESFRYRIAGDLRDESVVEGT